MLKLGLNLVSAFISGTLKWLPDLTAPCKFSYVWTLASERRAAVFLPNILITYATSNLSFPMPT